METDIDDYHSDYTHVGKTMLDLFFESPMDFYLTYVTREMEPKGVKKAGKVGLVGHAIVEGKSLDEVMQVVPDEYLNAGGSFKNGGEARLAEDFPGIIFLKAREYLDVKKAVEAIMSHPLMVETMERSTEQEKRHNATIEGVQSKCKPDFARIATGEPIDVVDLKFMECVRHSRWRKSCRDFRHWLQAEHYSAVLEAKYQADVDFSFLICETKFPYRVKRKVFPVQTRDEGKAIYLNLMRELNQRATENNWEDRDEEETVLGPWDMCRDGSGDQLEEVERGED